MFCQRCNKPLTDDEAERIDNPGTSGAGSTVVVCKNRCRPVPSPTGPSGPGQASSRSRRAVRRPRW